MVMLQVLASASLSKRMVLSLSKCLIVKKTGGRVVLTMITYYITKIAFYIIKKMFSY